MSAHSRLVEGSPYGGSSTGTAALLLHNGNELPPYGTMPWRGRCRVLEGQNNIRAITADDDMPIADLTTEYLQDLLDQFGEKVSRVTLNGYHKRWMGFSAWLVENEYVDPKVFGKVVCPKVRKDRDRRFSHGLWTREDVYKLSDKLLSSDDWRKRRLGICLQIQYTLALRASEVITLKVRDFVEADTQISAHITLYEMRISANQKSAKESYLPVPTDLVAVLKEYIEWMDLGPDDEIVFRTNKHFNSRLSSIYREALGQHGLPTVDSKGRPRTAHGLRHSRITELALNMPVHVLSKFARHAKPETTLSYYAHVENDLMRSHLEEVG